MGRRPTKAADNPYCRARLAAARFNDKLNSKEGAAELLGLHVSSLSDYELGNTKIVPVDKVNLMADLYNAPELKNYYCSEVCPLGSDVPRVNPEDLDRITLKALAVLNRVSNTKDALLEIVSDGIITEEEKPTLNQIMMHLDEVVKVAQSLKMWVQKNME